MTDLSTPLSWDISAAAPKRPAAPPAVTDATGPGKDKGSRAAFLWPTPPYASYPAPCEQTETLPCQVTSGPKNKAFSARLTFFVSETAVAHVQMPPARTTVPLRFDQFTSLTLTTPLRPLPLPLSDPHAELLRQRDSSPLHREGDARPRPRGPDGRPRRDRPRPLPVSALRRRRQRPAHVRAAQRLRLLRDRPRHRRGAGRGAQRHLRPGQRGHGPAGGAAQPEDRRHPRHQAHRLAGPASGSHRAAAQDAAGPHRRGAAVARHGPPGAARRGAASSSSSTARCRSARCWCVPASSRATTCRRRWPARWATRSSTSTPFRPRRKRCASSTTRSPRACA